jgi:hypothetical protein
MRALAGAAGSWRLRGKSAGCLGRVELALMLPSIIMAGKTADDWWRASKEDLRHTRMGWKEPPQEQKFSGAIGTYDLSKLSDDKLKRANEILARAAISATPGVPGGDSDA